MGFIDRAVVWLVWGSVGVVLFAFLPTTAPGDPVFTLPDYVFDPLVGVLQLDRYFPIGVFLAIVAFDISLRIGLFAWWAGSYIWGKVMG